MSSQSTRSAGSWLSDSITRNPEGLLLLAAGCALLMRKTSALRSEPVGDEQWSGPTENSEHMRGLKQGVEDVTNNVREYASDVTEKVSDKAGEYISSLTGYADEVSVHAHEMGRQASAALQSSAQNILQQQPLAVAVAGLAVGAAVAAAFPPTEIERRNLGAAGERLKDAATNAKAKLKDAGLQAKEKLASVAEERGLTTEGMKDITQEVTEAFNDALSDDHTVSRRASTTRPSTGAAESESSRTASNRGQNDRQS